jgi:sugar/nucleoside kinase (ribokinase family)
VAIRNSIAKIWDVAVAGEIYADLVFSGFERWPEPGEEHFTDHYLREAGGGAIITACALSRLGREAAVFGVAGEQDLWLHQRLRDFGVHLEGLRLGEIATAVSVAISTREDRSFLTWRGANRGLATYLAETATQDLLAQAKHVHLAMPVERELASVMFPRLRAAGCTISLDVGHHVDWLRDPENWLTCAEVDFFLPNQKEAQIVTGKHHPEDLLTELHARGMANVVLKLGREGAAALLAGQTYHAAALAVDAVDTTGAGDAFDAGFLDAFLEGAHATQMLERGCLCGSLSTRKPGALNALPSRQELNQFHAD